MGSISTCVLAYLANAGHGLAVRHVLGLLHVVVSLHYFELSRLNGLVLGR